MTILQSLFNVMLPMPVFKPEMRQANRDGLKSQTRRIIPEKLQIRRNPAKEPDWFVDNCKYGETGDFAYMREPLMHGLGDVAYYMDDNKPVHHPVTGEEIKWRWKKDTLSSIFMPREAARFIYQYTDIRVERVQDISRNDAKAEGASGVWRSPPDNKKHFTRVLMNPYVANYSVIWDLINEERGYSWESNPWVWVLVYRRVVIAGPGTVGKSIDGLKPNLLIFDDFLEV